MIGGKIMKLAWKEIRFNKKKYILIELILIMMMFMVIFLSGLANGLARAVSAGIDNAPAQNYVLSTDAQDLISVSSVNNTDLDKVREVTGDKVTPLDLQMTNINKKGDSKKISVTYFAINPEDFLNPKAVEGQKLSDKKDTIVLDSSLKDSGIKVGDVVKDSSIGTQFTVVGFAKNQMYGHAPIGFISLDTYAELKKSANPMSLVEQKYNALAINGKDIKNIKVTGLEVVDRKTIIKNIPGYTAEQMTINMILWVLVFVSAVVLGVFFYIMTLQKHKEFGVTKAIGMNMLEIAGIQMSQILILAIFGVIIGNALGFGMASVLPSSMPFYLKTSSAAEISGAFILISIVCSLVSIREIAKVDPITIIGGN